MPSRAHGMPSWGHGVAGSRGHRVTGSRGHGGAGRRPYGKDQRWLAVFSQLARVSRVPLAVEFDGSVRHFPLAARTYSPLARRVHAWSGPSRQGSRNAVMPPVMHLPATWSSRLAMNVIRCGALPVQDQMSILFPMLLRPP